MPFIDENPSMDLGRPIDFPKGFTVTPGAADLEDSAAKPAWNWAASFRRNNELAAAASSNSLWTLNEQETGFNPWEKIKGTPDEANFERLAEARNQRKFDAIKADITRENEDRKLLDSQPWWMGLVTEGLASILSPTTLLPGGTFVKGAKGGIAIARGAASVGLAAGAGTAVQEGMLQGIEQTRTAGETATAIGASVFLGGLLGAGGSALLSKAEWQKGLSSIERDLEAPRVGLEPLDVLEAANNNGAMRSVGAAANVATDISDNSIAGRAASMTAAATAQMNPLLRALHSPSAAYREIATDLVENPLYLRKNFEGVASQPAVETLMKEYNGGLAKALEATNSDYLEYRKAGGQLDKSEFREAVGKAMRRGDADPDPVIARVADQWRAKVFDPLKKQAIDAKLLPADVSVDTAQSYFTRMWNSRKISSDEAGFKAMVEEHINAQMPKMLEAFDRETAEREAKLASDKLVEYQVERRVERADRFNDKDAAKQIASEVFDTLTSRAGTGNRPDFITIKARGPLKERTFNIPDLFQSSNGRAVENYLEHDVEEVGRRYTRIMGADVEMTRRFGSVDMVDQINKIRDDYRSMREGISDEKELRKLAIREKSDISDLEEVRDLLRGGGDHGTSVMQSYASLVRTVNHFNFLRSMGEVSIASLTETVRPAMVHGLMPYMETIGQTITNMKGIRLSVGEAQLAGNVVERVLGTRLATLSEIVDPYAARGPVEAFMANMTNIASRWNGIRLLTDMQKSIAAVMTQNRLLRGAEMFGQVAEKERAYLAYMGIDQSMAERIAKQFADHGETVEKVRVANTEKWTDEVARRTYRAAINKDVDSIITTKGVADTPLFANTPTGKAMLQFKSFALASHQRVLLRGLQEDQARFVGGLIAMTTIGMMATWMKAASGNRLEKDFKDIEKKPGWLIAEGLDKAGLFAIPMELANTFEKATGFNPIKTPIKAGDEGGSISQKNQNRSLLGSVVGPTAGLIDDATQVLGLPKKIIGGEEITQGQKNAAERLLPFNSYLGIRQMLRYVINTPQQ